jgi:hypothetical protein
MAASRVYQSPTDSVKNSNDAGYVSPFGARSLTGAHTGAPLQVSTLIVVGADLCVYPRRLLPMQHSRAHPL